MKFELKGYQEVAAAKVLTGLRKGSQEYLQDGEHTAVVLSAPTGSGKTVIATAVIERVLFGDPEGTQEADPNAVFLWLTDDPSLNAQTKAKMLQASEKIQAGQLVMLDEGFDEPVLTPGTVNFLNIQKLSRTSSMVRRAEGKRKNPIWETLTATIKTHPGDYYLVIDEAHRGTGTKAADRLTIAQKLVQGEDGQVPPAPVVWAISATPERFEAALKKGAVPRLVREVPVPVDEVRESGLIKDVLAISHQGEKQVMETTLVRQAVVEAKAMDQLWNAYTDKEGQAPVRPVLVVQIPPNVTDAAVGDLLDVCVEEWDVLQGSAVVHSLQSHTAEQFGSHTVRYVAPQSIQDHPTARLVLFKEALTTGWDCPRAEVMVSLRTAQDTTYIAQLIGRMVRQPLARRIESDGRLNRVRLYLPNFDTAAVEKVRADLESDEDGVPTEIVVGSVDAPRNPAVPADLFTITEGLTSYVVPGPVHRSQVTRLHKLAALLVGDGLLPGAIEEADRFLCSILDAEKDRLAADGTLPARINDVETATVAVMSVQVHSGQESDTVTEDYATDANDVERLLAGARRKFRDGLAKHYWGYRVTDHDTDPYDAKVLTIALSNEQSVVEKVEAEAADRVRQWLTTYGDAIAALTEDANALYTQVRLMAKEPEPTHPVLPTGPITMPADKAIPAYDKHLYADRKGQYRTKLGDWEAHSLAVESKREGFVGWYRNPTGGQRALRVPFATDAGYGKMHPDLVVFHTVDGTIRPSIVDPHGHHLSDAAAKLTGLAAYAKKHGAEYHRILAVIKTTAGEYRMLDLKDPTIQAAVSKVQGKDAIEALFNTHGALYG